MKKTFSLLFIITIMISFLGCLGGQSGVETYSNLAKKNSRNIILFLVDNSLGMQENDRTKRQKLQVVRSTLSSFISKTDTRHYSFGLIAKDQSCNTAKVYVSKDNHDRSFFQYKLSKLKPIGSSDISTLLYQATEELQDVTQPVTVIIISDNSKSCGNDPILNIQNLVYDRNNITVHTINYASTQNDTLKQVATQGHGNYYQVHNTATLMQALKSIKSKRVVPATKAPTPLNKGGIKSYVFHFQNNSVNIKRSEVAQLKQLAQYLKETGYKAEVQGHTDSIGSAAVNKKVSKKRAQIIVNKLIDLGVDPNQLEAIGYGESLPIASNKTAKGRAKNRRVEVHIIKE